MIDNHQLRYPVGEFTAQAAADAATRRTWVKTITDFPALVRTDVEGMKGTQLAARYRPGGWTVRQVVHHCADSHLNAYLRFKLALTETTPVIKPYDEAAWAELPDSVLPVEPSLRLLEGVHARWVVLLESLSEADLERTFQHPEHGKPFSLLLALDNYQWHCRHHLEHIRRADVKY